jgi:hypothetical protein
VVTYIFLELYFLESVRERKKIQRETKFKGKRNQGWNNVCQPMPFPLANFRPAGCHFNQSLFPDFLFPDFLFPDFLFPELLFGNWKVALEHLPDNSKPSKHNAKNSVLSIVASPDERLCRTVGDGSPYNPSDFPSKLSSNPPVSGGWPELFSTAS